MSSSDEEAQARIIERERAARREREQLGRWVDQSWGDTVPG